MKKKSNYTLAKSYGEILLTKKYNQLKEIIHPELKFYSQVSDRIFKPIISINKYIKYLKYLEKNRCRIRHGQYNQSNTLIVDYCYEEKVVTFEQEFIVDKEGKKTLSWVMSKTISLVELIEFSSGKISSICHCVTPSQEAVINQKEICL